MRLRPEDSSGDILPVRSPSDLLSGTLAEAKLAELRLKLLAGDWWENEAWGNGIVDLLRETRVTEADSRTLAAYLTSYLRETPGIAEITDVSCALDGCTLRFRCAARTESGTFSVDYTL